MFQLIIVVGFWFNADRPAIKLLLRNYNIN